ncbi:hypothetical protein D3C72_1910220 [compost metagenome]
MQAAGLQQADELRQALASAQEQQRAAEQDAQAQRQQALADARQRQAEAAAAQEALQASRRSEADLAQRLAAAQTRADDLFGQITSRDQQFSDLARRLIAIQEAPKAPEDTAP